MNNIEQDLTPYQQELLVITMEECGETIQEICKVLRFGINGISHHYSYQKNHLSCLEQEIGDILCLVDLLVESDIGLTKVGLEGAISRKREKLKKWMKNEKSLDN